MKLIKFILRIQQMILIEINERTKISSQNLIRKHRKGEICILSTAYCCTVKLYKSLGKKYK